MSNVYELVAKGGPIMVPIVGLSILTIARSLERAWFWYQLISQEDKVVHDVLEAAHYDLNLAAAIAKRADHLPISRFLLAPLRLQNPTPETFHLALEVASDKELIEMHKGDKLFESVVGLAPLLGLLGTVTGLILTFTNLNIGGGSSAGTEKAAAGIGEALTATAGGMITAIVALAIHRVLVTFQAKQLDYFSIVGGELELIYRQMWYEQPLHQPRQSQANSHYPVPLTPSEH